MANVIQFPEPSQRRKPKGKKQVPDFYDIVATIKDIEPAIWREFLIPTDFPLVLLHDALSATFDWGGEHLYMFEQPKEKKLFYDFEMEEPIQKQGWKCLPDEGVLIVDLLPAVGAKATYTYDFGDYWEIDVEVKSSLSKDMFPFPLPSVCIDGDMAAPLEDIGGIGGWEMFLEAVNDPSHEMYQEMRVLADLEDDEDFNPERFLPMDVNTELAYRIRGPEIYDSLPNDAERLKFMVVDMASRQVANDIDRILLFSNMAAAVKDLGGDPYDML